MLRVISSCSQEARGCYTPYTIVLPASTPCTVVDDAGATAATIMRNSWLHCILFDMHLLVIVTPSTQLLGFDLHNHAEQLRSRIRYLSQ